MSSPGKAPTAAPRKRCVRFALLAALPLLASACSDGSPLAPPTLEPLEITTDGAWFRDRMGRVVILRGATYTLTDGRAEVGNFGGDGERTIDQMERLGMNLVRLPLAWSQLEPRPRRFAPYYLIERVDPVLRWAAAHGMAIVLSMRAWPYGACDGKDPSVPEWVCRMAKRAARSAAGPSVEPACAFWTARDPEGATLLDHFLDTWSVVAQYYAGDPRVIGLDLIDEPSGAGCFEEMPFLHGVLTPYFRRLAATVRTFGYRGALLFEPPVAPDAPLPGEVRRLGLRAVYAPHLYGQRFGAGSDVARGSLGEAYHRAAAQAKQIRAPLLIGEYGGDLPPDESGHRGASPAFAAQSLEELDRHRIGGAFFALRPRSEKSARVEIGDVANALAHPYARRIAGIPLEMKFDPETRAFRLRFEDDAKLSPPDPTEIFLPRPLYPGGPEVTVKPAGRWTFDQHSQRLLVYRGGSEDGGYEIVVRPDAGRARAAAN